MRKITLSFFVLSFLITGCTTTYRSAKEAYFACSKWVAGGKTIKVDANWEMREKIRMVNELASLYGVATQPQVDPEIIDKSNRVCDDERQTKQVLGIEYDMKSISKQPITQKEYDELKSSGISVIQKYFKY
jgi:hypothetical protein